MRGAWITRFLFWCTGGVILLIIFNVLVLHVVRRQYSPGSSTSASIFNLSGQIHEWSGYVARWKQLSDETSSLKALSNQYVAAQAQIQTLQNENDLLRKAAGLSTRLKRKLIPAGIFDVSLTPAGYRASLNKGSKDGVAEGEAVISPDGLLLGIIANVFPSSSRVMLTTDPQFSVAVKVLSGQTSGILRGALSDGLTLDLITQSDQITEGDTLVTTGNDSMPAGLVTGTVRNVQNNDTQLFKKVKVSPAADPSASAGAALVVQS